MQIYLFKLFITLLIATLLFFIYYYHFFLYQQQLSFKLNKKKMLSDAAFKNSEKSKLASKPTDQVDDAVTESLKNLNLPLEMNFSPRILKRYGGQTELIDRFADILQAQEQAAFQVGDKFNILVSGGAGGDYSIALRLLAATLLRYHHHHRRALAAEPAYFKNLCGWNIFFADERCVAQFDNESFFEMFYEWAYETVIQYPQHPEVYDVYYYAKPPGLPKPDIAPDYLQESKPATYDETVYDMVERYEAKIDQIVTKALHARTHQQLPQFDLVLLDLAANGTVAGMPLSGPKTDLVVSTKCLHLVTTNVCPAYFTVLPQVLEMASNVFVFVDPMAAAADGVEGIEQQERCMANTLERVLKPTLQDLALPAARLYQSRHGDVEFFVHLGIHKRL